MVEYPKTVRPIFIKGLPLLHKIVVSWRWPLVRKLMIKGMDLGAEQFEDSKRILEGELNWLDGLLSDGRPYLAGERFSRADLAAASLLAPLASPKEHPTYGALNRPPRFAANLAGWEGRPSILWVREIYKEHR